MDLGGCKQVLADRSEMENEEFGDVLKITPFWRKRRQVLLVIIQITLRPRFIRKNDESLCQAAGERCIFSRIALEGFCRLVLLSFLRKFLSNISIKSVFCTLKSASQRKGEKKHGKHLLEQQLSIMAAMLHSIFIDIVIISIVSSLDEKFSFHSWMDTTFLMSSRVAMI